VRTLAETGTEVVISPLELKPPPGDGKGDQYGLIGAEITVRRREWRLKWAP